MASARTAERKSGKLFGEVWSWHRDPTTSPYKGCEGLGSSEAACEALGGVLRHSRTLRLLDLSQVGMDASGLGYLRSGLGANPHSALRVLNLSGSKVGAGAGGGGGAVQVAALLRHTVCPSLQHLKMVEVGLDVEGAELIGHALARNNTLRRLRIGKDDADAVLLFLRTGMGATTDRVIDAPVFQRSMLMELHISGMTDENVAQVEVLVSNGKQHVRRVMKSVMKKTTVDGVNWGGRQSGNCSSGLQNPRELEPEPLPVALQELLDDLGSSQWPSPTSPSASHTYPRRRHTELPDLDNVEYGAFFNSVEFQGTSLGVKRWGEVRVEVLSAIGKCSTLTKLLPKYYIGRHGRIEEMKALWGGLASIASYSSLETLDITSCKGLGSEAACAALGGFLRHSPKIREFMLSDIGMHVGGLGQLRMAMEANPHFPLRLLILSDNKVGGGGAAGGAVHVAALLHHTVCPSLQQLQIRSIGLDVEGAQIIGQALARNTSLQKLVVGGEGEAGLGVLLRTGLASKSSDMDLGVAEAEGNKSMICLEIQGMTEEEVSDVDLVLRTNKLLEKMILRRSRCAAAKVGLEVDKAINLKTLKMGGEFSHDFDQIFFPSLQGNRTLQRLSLFMHPDEKRSEEIFTALMQSLDRNISLQVIDLDVRGWEGQGKYAIIREKLRRNAGLTTYLPTFYGQHFKFVTPTLGRLFLCGPPRAGKTTLRRSMVDFQTYSSKKSMVSLLRKYVRLPWEMTKGIEVESIIHHDENLQVSIWDLAGQAEYRILHDYLFPNIHQACVFTFVFSPFDHVLNKIMADRDICIKFENELKYWLRFISSNMEKRGRLKAELLVVISHLDKFKNREESIRNILKIKLNSLKKIFVDRICVSSGLEIIDAGSPIYMKNVLTKVFRTLKLLCENAKSVPEVCEKVSSALMKWVLRNPSQPFMGQEEFVAFCVQHVEELKKFVQADQNNIASAISSYLHDSGIIIYFKKFNLRVVNPNWITHIFLGKLIQSHSPLIEPTSQGFVERELLEHVLTTTFTNDPKYIGLKTQDLVNIMVELDLCYEAPLEDGETQGFYIPTTISVASNHTGRSLQWLTQVEKDVAYEFLGRRLQCGDQLRTFLTEGFFPRFQVVLRNRLFSKLDLGMRNHQYRFGHNLISMVCDHIDILIECSGGGVIGDYVDILVRSKRCLGFASTFMKQHVLEDLRAFCASPKGCPGVVLVEGIINPYCVSELIPCGMRQNQAYLREDYTKFLLDEKQALQCGDGLQEFVDADDLAYIVRSNAEFHKQQKDCIEKVASDLVPMTSEISTSSKSTSRPRSMSSAIRVSRYHSDLSIRPRNEVLFKHMMEKLDKIGDKQDQHHYEVMDKLDHNHIELLEYVRSFEAEVTKFKKETLRALESKMDDIIGYHSSSMPRRPYFSSDGISFKEWLMASIHMGKAVRLHLMCEQRGGNHIVQGQSGYPMVVEEKNCEWIRKASVNGAKLLLFLCKVGFHVAAGVGSAIPNTITVPALVGETLLNDCQYATMVATDDQVDAEVDGGLQEVLKSLQSQMWDLFQLTQVRYLDGKETAWLCNACTNKCKAAELVMRC